MKNEKLEVVRGSGNVFRDLGRQNADVERFKAILAAEIVKALDREDLSVRAAHSRTRIAAADFSRIRNASLARFRRSPDVDPESAGVACGGKGEDKALGHQARRNDRVRAGRAGGGAQRAAARRPGAQFGIRQEEAVRRRPLEGVSKRGIVAHATSE
jgi:hypothetical protein